MPRPDARWLAVVAVGLCICVGQFGLLFVAMNTGLPAGLASVIAPLRPVFTIPLAAVALGERQPGARSFECRSPSPVSGYRRRPLPRRPLAGRRARYRLGRSVGLRQRRDSSGENEATLLAPRLVKRRRTSAATRALADLRGNRTLAKRGLFDRCIRDCCPRLRRRRFDLLRVRHLVLAAVPPPSLDSCAPHPACAGRRDPHRVARPRRAPDLGRAARVFHRLGRPCARARCRRHARGTKASRRPRSYLVVIREPALRYAAGRPSLASSFGTERRSLPAARAEATPRAGPCRSA